jgi:hypothetical protein
MTDVAKQNVTISTMMPLQLFIWWYSDGWKRAASLLPRLSTGILQNFSVSSLAGTLFAPWRRIVSYPGAGLDAKLRAIGDNLVSRVVGFFVRLSVLLVAVLALLGSVIISIIWAILWPLLPISVVALIIRGVVAL